MRQRKRIFYMFAKYHGNFEPKQFIFLNRLFVRLKILHLYIRLVNPLPATAAFILYVAV